MFSQDELQADAHRLEIELRELQSRILRSGIAGRIKVSMAKEISAYMSSAVFAAQQAKFALSPFVGLTAQDVAEAEEASHR